MHHLPNLITVLRIVLVVPLCWLIGVGRYEGALAVAAVAGLSDAVDGWMAKRFGWQSWVGGMLDPLADKLLLTAAFIALALAGVLPAWLTVLVVTRDLVIVGGAFAYHRLIGRFSAAPSALSKGNTTIQIVFVLTELLRMAGWIALSASVQAMMIAIVAAFTFASGAHYVVVWSRRARRAAAARKEGR
ncbi:MAG: CDP-alcohol phosphatidyltransferase family protein [Rhodanobacter sp.]|jgi:cardiolipin synthase|nr:CDP-alcohol phosphatidyltransferase family protein [Rhodanobacter sp.]